MTALQESLADLNGDELYELVNVLTNALVDAAAQFTSTSENGTESRQAAELLAELRDTFTTVAIQMARITVPIREAQGVIWRAVYSRNHPVKVPGTN